MAESVPEKKKETTKKKPAEVVLDKKKQEELVKDFKDAAIEGIKEATKKAAEVKPFEPVEINVDLKKDGKYPHALAFVTDAEQKVHIEAEMPDGVVRKHHADVFPQHTDTFGVDYRAYGMKRYGVSGYFGFPAKRIISCTAKKIYALYID